MIKTLLMHDGFLSLSSLIFNPVRASRADTPAPPFGPSALTPTSEAGSTLYMAFSCRPAGPARIRVAPPAHGAAAGGRAPGSRPAPLSAAPGPGRARTVLYDRQLGPGRSRIVSALRTGSRAQPGPVFAVTWLTLCGARVAPGGARCVAAGGRGSRDSRRARGGRRSRSPPASLQLGPA